MLTWLTNQFNYVKHWADENTVLKTKEIVFKRPNPRLYITPLPITEVQQVSSAKLLGVTLCDTLRFDVHVGNVLKMCSQRVYLLKLLRDQALPRPQLNTVFDALVLSRLRYAVPVWSGFMSVELKGQVKSLQMQDPKTSPKIAIWAPSHNFVGLYLRNYGMY